MRAASPFMKQATAHQFCTAVAAGTAVYRCLLLCDGYTAIPRPRHYLQAAVAMNMSCDYANVWARTPLALMLSRTCRAFCLCEWRACVHELGHCPEWPRAYWLESTSICFAKLAKLLLLVHVPSIAACASLHAMQEDLHPQIRQCVDVSTAFY